MRSYRIVLIYVLFVISACASPASQSVTIEAPRTPSSSTSQRPTANPVHATSPEERTETASAEKDYSILVKWNEVTNLTPKDAVLVVEGSDLGFDSWDHKPNFDILTWDGERSNLFELKLNEPLDLENPNILVLPMRSPTYFAFALSDSINAREIYWLQLSTQQVFGYKPACENLMTAGEDAIAAGNRWGAYVCDEDQTTWHYFNLSNPTDAYEFELPVDRDIADGFEPFWIADETLVLDRGFRQRCLVNVSEPEAPEISCAKLGLILGKFSPNLRYLELRQAIDTIPSRPQRIGYIETGCLNKTASCDAVLFPSPIEQGRAPGDLEEATWIPDGSGILYIELMEDPSSSSGNLITLLWKLSLNDGSFTEIAEIKEPLYFHPSYMHGNAIWSPTGKQVILQNNQRIYSLNLDSGALELLNEDGGVALGAVRLQ